MRLYAKCQKELYGNIVQEYDHGFISHKPVTKDGGIYVQLLYVEEEHRKNGVAKSILIDTCDRHGATYVTGYIDLTTNNYKQTLMAHLKAGYDIVDAKRDSLIVSITKETLLNG